MKGLVGTCPWTNPLREYVMSEFFPLKKHRYFEFFFVTVGDIEKRFLPLDRARRVLLGTHRSNTETCS
jgi:hypothetical protein